MYSRGLSAKQLKCKHTYRLCYSTFGADQGAMCTKCWRDSPLDVYQKLKIKELEEQIDRIKKL